MKRLLNVLWVFSGLILVIPNYAFSQEEFRSEDELIKQAGKLFNAADYAGALPLYSNIVSNRPDNSEFNYRFGVCMVEAGAEKEDAVRYLKLASTSPQTPEEVTLYLARALHAGGFFEEALESLERYRSVASRSDWSNSVAGELEGNCRTGIAMRVNTTGVEHRILSAKDCSMENFHQFYQFKDAWGKFLKVPKQYESKESAGTAEGTYLFISADGGTMLLARTAEKKSTGFDIYRSRKEITGRFSDPVKLPVPVNTADLNEAFATASGKGGTMYFSRKGKGSMGGYDIFRTTLEPATGQWSDPENMGVPVNSPGNDMFYVPSMDGKTCFFLTDRNSPAGGYQAIRANVTTLNDLTAVVNGKIDCISCPSNMEVRITVTSVTDRSLANEFKVTPENPVYSVRLQAPETYMFTVSAPGFPVFTDVVELPELSRSGYLQQILITRSDDGSEALRIFTKKTDESMLATSVDSKAGQDVVQSSLIAQRVDEMMMTEDAGDRRSDGGSAGQDASHDLQGIEISGTADRQPEQQATNDPGKSADEAAVTGNGAPALAVTSTSVGMQGSEDTMQQDGNENPTDNRISDDDPLNGGEVDLPEINVDTERQAQQSLDATKADGAAAMNNDKRLEESIEAVNSITAGEVVLTDNSSQEVIRGEFETDATEISAYEEEQLQPEENGGSDPSEESPDTGNIPTQQLTETAEDGTDAAPEVPVAEVDPENDPSEAEKAGMEGMTTDPAGELLVSANSDVISGEFDAEMSALKGDDQLNGSDQPSDNTTDSKASSESNRNTGNESDDPVNIEEQKAITAKTQTSAVADDNSEHDNASTDPTENTSADANKALKQGSEIAMSASASDQRTGTDETAAAVTQGIKEQDMSDAGQEDIKAMNPSAVVEGELTAVDDGSETEESGNIESNTAPSTEDPDVMGNLTEQSSDVNGSDDESTDEPASAERQQMDGVSTNDVNPMEVDGGAGVITGEFDASMTVNGGEKPEEVNDGLADSQTGSENSRSSGGSNVQGTNATETGPITSGNDELNDSGNELEEVDQANSDVSNEDQVDNISVDGSLIASAVDETNENAMKDPEERDLAGSGSASDERMTYTLTDEAKLAYPDLVFKVQVGAFNQADAERLVSFFRDKGLNLLTNAVNQSGMTTVMTGSFNGYEEARVQRDRIRQEGYEDAFVVVFNGQNRLKISDVLKAENAE